MTVMLTHKGWFGLCPVYISGAETGEPMVTPRCRALEFLIPWSERLLGLWFSLRCLVDPLYIPEWPLVITGRIEPRPAPWRHEDPA